jgi:hypothetical protein
LGAAPPVKALALFEETNIPRLASPRVPITWRRSVAEAGWVFSGKNIDSRKILKIRE